MNAESTQDIVARMGRLLEGAGGAAQSAYLAGIRYYFWTGVSELVVGLGILAVACLASFLVIRRLRAKLRENHAGHYYASFDESDAWIVGVLAHMIIALAVGLSLCLALQGFGNMVAPEWAAAYHVLHAE